MFDRKLIKTQAKGLIKRSYLSLIIVVFLAGLLGATIGCAGGSSVNLSSVFNGNSTTTTTNSNWFSQGILGGLFGWDTNDDWYDQDTDDDWYDQDWDDDWMDQIPEGWMDQMPGDGQTEEIKPGDLWGDIVGSLDWGSIWSDLAKSLGVALSIIIIVFVVIILLTVVISVLFHVFISNIVTAGVNGWLMRYWRGETPSIGDGFVTFRTYAPVVKAMFLRDLFTFLWSLLFVIPGIIKSLAYAMVPYIIYENPNLTPSQALKISEKMTDGAKGDLFVLGLSFIGWNFLSALTGGILGVLYVNPYIGLTYAGVYDQLKWNAIQGGRLTWADFGQVQPVYDQPAVEDFGG